MIGWSQPPRSRRLGFPASSSTSHSWALLWTLEHHWRPDWKRLGQWKDHVATGDDVNSSANYEPAHEEPQTGFTHLKLHPSHDKIYISPSRRHEGVRQKRCDPEVHRHIPVQLQVSQPVLRMCARDRRSLSCCFEVFFSFLVSYWLLGSECVHNPKRPPSTSPAGPVLAYVSKAVALNRLGLYWGALSAVASLKGVNQ